VSIRGTLEKKLLAATKKETEQKIALDAANIQIADVSHTPGDNANHLVEKSIKRTDCCGGSGTETTN
jgi:hypothetical protein